MRWDMAAHATLVLALGLLSRPALEQFERAAFQGDWRVLHVEAKGHSISSYMPETPLPGKPGIRVSSDCRWRIRGDKITIQLPWTQDVTMPFATDTSHCPKVIRF